MRPAILALAAALLLAGAASAQAPRAPNPPPKEAKPMERVDGIGGFFFRAKDPKALARWYADHLGVNSIPTSYDQEPWRQAAGPTAFAPFPADTKYFGRPEQAFMLNFRVKDLDAMVAQLRRDGIAVEVDPQTYPNGRFAQTHDPEGNPIQLWQPKAP
jgi:catechol 2,3-dioxygenase-like lactoylglutathione lyase family enzyme